MSVKSDRVDCWVLIRKTQTESDAVFDSLGGLVGDSSFVDSEQNFRAASHELLKRVVIDVVS